MIQWSIILKDLLIIFFEFKFSFEWTILVVINSYLCSPSIFRLLFGCIINSLDPKDLIDFLRFIFSNGDLPFHYLQKFALIFVSFSQLQPTIVWRFRFIWTIKFVFFFIIFIYDYCRCEQWTSLFLRLFCSILLSLQFVWKIIHSLDSWGVILAL